MKSVHTLILLVADHDIRLLRQDGIGNPVVETSHVTRDDLPDVDFSFPDKMTSFSGHGMSRHNAEPRLTKREKERVRMIGHAVQELTNEWARGGYDRIVIGAPAKVLGLLRDALPNSLAEHLSFDFDKDLVSVPAQELPAHFPDAAGLALRPDR